MFEYDGAMTFPPSAVPDTVARDRVDGHGGHGGAGLVARIRELEEIKSAACAEQARLAVELDRLRRAEHAAVGIPTSRQGQGVDAEVAIARRESPHQGGRLLGLGKALVTELPHTLNTLEAGLINEWRATVVARATAHLSRADRAIVDERLFGTEAARAVSCTWGNRRLEAETRTLAITMDQEGEVRRRARAMSERRVSVRPAPARLNAPGMVYLTALVPLAQGVAAYATLSRDADQTRATGAAQTRSRGQVMADTLIERLTGQRTATGVPVAVQLVVCDTVLFNNNPHARGTTQPGWVHAEGLSPYDLGPLTPEHTRELITTALTHATVTLRRLYTNPSGRLTATESMARAFPAALARHITTRDRACRQPWCDAPIRHTDHLLPHQAGGPTTATNAQGLCEHDNYTKQAPGWTTQAGPEATTKTTTPTGITTHTTPPTLPTPAPTITLVRHGPTLIWAPDN